MTDVYLCVKNLFDIGPLTYDNSIQAAHTQLDHPPIFLKQETHSQQYCTTGYYQRWVVHLLQSGKSLKWNFLEPSKEVQTADQRPRSKTQFNIWIWLFKDFFRRRGKSRLCLVIVAQLIEVCCNYHLVIKDQRGRQFINSNVPTLDQEGTCSSWRLGCWHSCARAALRGGSALPARS